MHTILRLRLGPSLPCQKQRTAALQRHFADATITDIWPTEDPGQLFEYIQSKITALNAVAVEIDTTDRMLPTLIAVGAWMKAFATVPVLYPFFQDAQSKRFPTFDLNTHRVLVPAEDEVQLVGFAELCDAVPIPTPRNDIAV
jgi:hypothetical protein